MKMPTSKKKSNIPWKGALNNHLVSILSKEYIISVAPPSGQSKKSICAGWGRILGIGDKDPTGGKVKQNVDEIVSTWKQANGKRNSNGFGHLVKDDRTNNNANAVFKNPPFWSVQVLDSMLHQGSIRH